MKLFSSLALALYLACTVVHAESFPSLSENGDLTEEGRFGFLTLDDSGATLTFNSTSLQYAVVAGIALLLVGLVLIPVLGYDVASFLPARNDETPPQFSDYNNYDYTSTYSQFAKRSLDAFSPILLALRRAYDQYEK